jgi:hypothetical protein
MAMKRWPKMAVMACALGVLAWAVWITPTGAPDRAWAADVPQCCRGVPAGQRQGGLKAHVTELSAPCQARLQVAAQRVQDLREACQGEAAPCCPGVGAAGTLAPCLQPSVSDVSPACKMALTPAKPTRKPRP